ncbi:DUF4326 domain-containing protein [Phaeobacter piscinae]|uniref:DUF4326 domain-containing protein n=1 Tax=Phaeobacter piscinae TaxID=1580596 RepID=UPI00058C4EC3
MPKRVQMRRDRPWRQDNPEAVIVARPSKWGNPWRVGEIDIPDAKEAVRRFAAAVLGNELGPPTAHPESTVGKIITDAPKELRGRDLACWCPLDQPCHADVLLKLANDEV